MLTVLNVAYPLAPVGPAAVGGAEQSLAALDKALVNAGHRSVVLAMRGSQAEGELLPVDVDASRLDEPGIARARGQFAAALDRAIGSVRPDVVHMHGFDYDRYLPPPGPPVLATLHCPPGWYGEGALHPRRDRTWLNAVSPRQHSALQPNDRLLEPIENGVAIGQTGGTRRTFVLQLSRIAPEKGVHIALRAAHRAGLPMLVAGQVFAYPEHQRYFASQVRPLLDTRRRCIGPVGGAHKHRLLASARCVVVPSLTEETSSLVAREALAAGTPVVAFPAGALADAVEHGRTGYLVHDEAAMARAMVEAARIDPAQCREAAATRFSLDGMVARYFDLYGKLARGDL